MGAREKITYSLANLAAVLSALYIAFWLDLDRPYWAMFSVFIVSKPISGAVRAKGVYRFAGTLIGASMSVFLVPPLVQAPVLLSLAVSTWVGFCLLFALQDRTPRSYAFLLAGYSVAIVGLSTVNEPTTIFDVALSRLEEITIGIICASVAHTILFPRNIGDVLQAKADEAIRHAALVANKAIGPNPVPPSIAEVATLANAIASLDALYAQIDLETSNVPRLPIVMGALLDRLACALPRASLVCGSIEAIRREGQMSDRLRETLKEVSTALSFLARGELPAPHSSAVAGSADSSMPYREVHLDTDALEALAVRHATTAAEALIESKELAAALTVSGSAKSVSGLLSKGPRRPFYRDPALAFLSAASATTATLIACALWIETSWPEGFVAAQFAAIGCSLFATLDAPSEPIFAAIVGILVALPVAALYEFAILPGVDGFALLALVLTPAMLLFSYLQTFERLEGAAMVLAIAFSGGLALQESFVSNFASFANSNLAEIIGLLIGAATLLVFRTIDPVWNARRVLNSGWAVICELAGPRTNVPGAWVLPMFDRVGQAAIRLDGHESGVAIKDVLFGLRIGLNVADLQQSKVGLGGIAAARIDDALRLLGNLDPAGSGSAAVTKRRLLSLRLGRLATTLSRLPPSNARMEGRHAVMGLRLDLDPRFSGSEASP
jgi:uncharacterized membrane protein YccC